MTAPAQTLLADPPWPFEDRLPGGGRGAEKHYPTMTIDEIAAFRLPPLADDCRLFLWRVASMQREALDVLDAWGFQLKAEVVWVKSSKPSLLFPPAIGRFAWPWPLKLRIGMGRQVRNAHEVCLIGVRGRPARLAMNVPSVIVAPRERHSAKPEASYELIERLSPGPRVELFGRYLRPGWTVYGNEVGRTVPDTAAAGG